MVVLVAPLEPQEPVDMTLTRPPIGPVCAADQSTTGEGVGCGVADALEIMGPSGKVKTLV